MRWISALRRVAGLMCRGPRGRISITSGVASGSTKGRLALRPSIQPSTPRHAICRRARPWASPSTARIPSPAPPKRTANAPRKKQGRRSRRPRTHLVDRADYASNSPVSAGRAADARRTARRRTRSLPSAMDSDAQAAARRCSGWPRPPTRLGCLQGRDRDLLPRRRDVARDEVAVPGRGGHRGYAVRCVGFFAAGSHRPSDQRGVAQGAGSDQLLARQQTDNGTSALGPTPVRASVLDASSWLDPGFAGGARMTEVALDCWSSTCGLGLACLQSPHTIGTQSRLCGDEDVVQLRRCCDFDM